ncbi:MAG: hypothetical protein K2H53_03860 [Clostridia bacterium]|nr:hypothetical protein [Clostridia bacterium]
MIIPLYFQSKGILDKSCLYLSEYLEKNKDKYFDTLNKVRINSDIISWIKFFLEAIIQTVKLTIERLDKLVILEKEMDKVALSLPVKPENAIKVIETLYDEPVIDIVRLRRTFRS